MAYDVTKGLMQAAGWTLSFKYSETGQPLGMFFDIPDGNRLVAGFASRRPRNESEVENDAFFDIENGYSVIRYAKTGEVFSFSGFLKGRSLESYIVHTAV